MAPSSPSIKLTEFSHGAGCGCKIAPSVLEEILKNSRTGNEFKNLIVGNESGDDAAVYELENRNCLISTTDFFMPIVDDAYDFGRIAAANALNDVYAMGGRPILALAILGWPVEKLPVELAQEILKGGKSVCVLAGIPLAGGHTIDSPEPIFGLAVNGLVKKENIRRNNTAMAGDLLYLTKPLGTGILSTALKRKLITDEAMKPAIEVMCTLNLFGEKLGTLGYIHALTDVTGFGLLGHLMEMCDGSHLSTEINYSKIKLIDGVEPLAKKFIAPDNTFRNWKSYESKVSGIGGETLVTLCDPQTSGGLLIAADPSHRKELQSLLEQNGLTDYAEPIGKFITGAEKRVILNPDYLYLPVSIIFVFIIAMILIDRAIISEDLVEKHFVCALDKCQGACCVSGDSGAPLEQEETNTLEEIFEEVKPFMSTEGIEAVNQFGHWMIDGEGDFVTPLVNGVRQCAYTIFENGTAKCAIEKAYEEGKTNFKKPISCHLYPIRIKKYPDYDAVNYSKWGICSPACANGKELGVPVFQFVKSALIRKYGSDWYTQLEGAVKFKEHSLEP